MKTLTKFSAVLVASLVLAGTAQATLYDGGWTVNAAIPDGNPTGWSDTRTVSGLDASITDVNVVLNITGGYNGDLYGYLVHSSGFVVLLDRVGTGSGGEPQNSFGYSTSGFGSITLDQSDNTSIHNVEVPNPLSPGGGDGTYRPDSGGLNTGGLNSFNTLNPNGTWTLFLADMSGDGNPSTLVSWGLDIEAVPEPVTWALMGFGMIFLAVATVRARLAHRVRVRASHAE